MDTDFLDHWKTGMVIDELQDKCAPIYILRLWAHCQERKSDCFAMPSRGLKAQCKYDGDHEKFEAALVAAGFIERDGETIKVIGWAEKNASLIAAWENGGKGGRPKKEPTGNPAKTHGLATGNPAVTQGQPSANPTLTQTKPIRVDKSREEEIHTSAAKLPTCPQEQIVSLYHKHLPELPSVRLMTDKRKKAIRKFWEFVLTSKRSDGELRATDEQTALEWIEAFFLRARDNDFLMGRIPRVGAHANWQPDLEFLLSDSGKSQVIEKTREAA